MRPEYQLDYSKAVRGKYHKRLLREGSNVVILDPDVAKSFRDSTAVNEALRALITPTDSTRLSVKSDAIHARRPSHETGKIDHLKVDRVAERGAGALYKRGIKTRKVR